MEIISVGSKLYHYIYGAMTVTATDNNCVYTSVDTPNGIAEKSNASKTWPERHAWTNDSIGKVVFADPKDVKQFTPIAKDVEEYHPEYLNAMFSGGASVSRGISGVHVKDEAAQSVSGVHIVGDERTDGISGVTIKR